MTAADQMMSEEGAFSSRVWPHPVMLFLGPAADPCRWLSLDPVIGRQE
jgi:hypothetical protein